MKEILEKIVDAVKTVEMMRREAGEKEPFPCERTIPIDVTSRMDKGFFCIAEVKKGSPSQGIIRDPFDPVAIAESYRRGGADAISVVTEENYFYGKREYLSLVRNTLNLPILRKDFLLSVGQVVESFNLGADMVLLIAACVDDVTLSELHQTSRELGMTAIVEVHDEGEVERALRLNPRVIGINNRNLKNFSLDLDTSMRLKEKIPRGIHIISESGIRNGTQVSHLKQEGFSGILVGETLLRQRDCEAALRELIDG